MHHHMVLWIHLHLVFEWGQQLREVVELSRVDQEIGFKLVGTDRGILLTQLMELKVWHHFHVLLDQSSVCIKVSWLLWKEWRTTWDMLNAIWEKSHRNKQKQVWENGNWPWAWACSWLWAFLWCSTVYEGEGGWPSSSAASLHYTTPALQREDTRGIITYAIISVTCT